eukprot:4287160-Prymnesium_polylepis.1
MYTGGGTAGDDGDGAEVVTSDGVGDGDIASWTMVDLARGEAQRRSTQRTAFNRLSEWELARCADYAKAGAQHATLLALLQKHAAHGREELQETVGFLAARAAADGAYAAALSKQKLGGRPIGELGDMRAQTALVVAPPGGAAPPPLSDASGAEELRAVRAVL